MASGDDNDGKKPQPSLGGSSPTTPSGDSFQSDRPEASATGGGGLIGGLSGIGAAVGGALGANKKPEGVGSDKAQMDEYLRQLGEFQKQLIESRKPPEVQDPGARTQEEARAARDRQRKLASQSGGRRGTIATSPLGVVGEVVNQPRRTILGG